MPAGGNNGANPETALAALDAASRTWVAGLRSDGARHDRCVRELHALLLRVARREVNRRRGWLGGATGPELDDLAHQSANDALLGVIENLDTYRGDSRFTTWAYRLVVNHVSTKVQHHLWNGPQVQFGDVDWDNLTDRLIPSPYGRSEQRAQLDALRTAVDEILTARQREVFVAVALNEVPIDAIASRLDSTRGAIYKTLFDARMKLRAYLAEAGYPLEEAT